MSSPSVREAGVIFDMDGVLVASGPAHIASWKMAAKKRGLAMSDGQFIQYFGMPSRDIIRALWGPQVTDAQIREIDDDKEAIYRQLITGMVPLMIGVRETLAALHSAGLKLAIGTSGPRENVELVLRESGLGVYFSGVVTGFDVKNGKPAPDCFLLAAERIGLPPRQTPNKPQTSNLFVFLMPTPARCARWLRHLSFPPPNPPPNPKPKTPRPQTPTLSLLLVYYNRW